VSSVVSRFTESRFVELIFYQKYDSSNDIFYLIYVSLNDILNKIHNLPNDNFYRIQNLLNHLAIFLDLEFMSLVIV